MADFHKALEEDPCESGSSDRSNSTATKRAAQPEEHEEQELSSYELQRNANMRSNQDELVRLGLGDLALNLCREAAKAPRKK